MSIRRSLVSPYFDVEQRDQLIPMPTAPPTFAAFKFESRKTRIDWRLLHGVDINPIVGASWMVQVELNWLYVIHALQRRFKDIVCPGNPARHGPPQPLVSHYRSVTSTWTLWRR